MPLGVSRQAVDVLQLAVAVARGGNVNAISDAASGAAMARAALTGSGLNVRINCPNLQDQQAAQGFVKEINQLDEQAKALEAELRQALTDRGNLAW